jgi:ferredoxin--NADP+ reductase
VSLRLAVVGAGPAGFYAAGQLLSGPADVEVDVFDRLPTPWGLVRSGVAPDHPKIKSVSRIFERTAAMPGFRFFGNVEIGTVVGHEELARHYHAVLYTVGAASDRRLGVPGEDLPGSHSATDFVAWYNGHPDHCDASFDLSTRRAIVVGNGNVALDVARMLVLSPEELAVTDIADHALAALTDSAVEEVVVLGRRGPAQAAYTTPELLELGELRDADVTAPADEAALDDHSRAFLNSGGASAAVRRNVEIVQGYARGPVTGKRKCVLLRFLRSPVQILGAECVEGVRVVRNTIAPTASGRLASEPSADSEDLEAGLVFRAVGYTGAAVAGVPFDSASGTVPNVAGRVTDADGEVVPGVYTAGWIKRGPSGVIGTNKKCATETVASLLEDAAEGRLPQPPRTPDELLDAMARRSQRIVDYAGWTAIDELERSTGQSQGRPRVKLVKRRALLDRAAMAC